jgi:uncharacterized protein with PhoU and TrkA domain
MILYTHLLQLYEEADIQLHTFLTPALDEAEEGLKQLHIPNQSRILGTKQCQLLNVSC